MLAPNLLISAVLVYSMCQQTVNGRYVDADDFTTLVAEVAAMKDERLEFNSRINQLEAKLGVTEAKLSAVEDRLVVTETKLAVTEEKLRNVDGKLDEALSQIDELMKKSKGWRDQEEETSNKVDNEDSVHETDTDRDVTTTTNNKRKIAIREMSTAGTGQITPQRIVRATEQQIAFSVHVNATITGLGKQHPIKFDGVELNSGNAYDAVIGVFICPVSGVYVFQSALMATQTDFIETEIVKDGSSLVRIFAAGSTAGVGFDQGFNSVITTCNQGEHVWVREYSGYGTIVYGYKFSSFSGYLIWEI